MRALEAAALKGNSQSARELRSWLEKYPPEDATLNAEDLDQEMRRRILARLRAEIEAEDAKA